MSRSIMEILQDKGISIVEQEVELDSFVQERTGKVRLLSVSDAIKEMINVRPSYEIKTVRQETVKINGRAYFTGEATETSISTVSLACKIKKRAYLELHSSVYVLSDGSSSPARYPHEWLLDTLKDIFDV